MRLTKTLAIALVISSTLCYNSYAVNVEVGCDVEQIGPGYVQETIKEITPVEEVTEVTYRHIGMFKLTSYCECRECNGKWVGHPTASGTGYIEGETIAVDRRVMPLGTKIEINIPGEGWKQFIAQDTGGSIKGNKIDIFVNGHSNTFQKKYNTYCEVRIQE